MKYIPSAEEVGVIMNNRSILILLFFLSLQLFSCSKDNRDKPEILAEINDYNLTLSEFQSKLAEELEMEKDFKLTREGKNDFLEDIIKKELLIQEAKKMNLDKGERFVRTIERYWESTLIRGLMEMKGDEISKTIIITREEIRNHYDSMKRSGTELPSLEEIEEDMAKELRERKRTKKLKEWIDGLREKAKIKIDRELLFKD